MRLCGHDCVVGGRYDFGSVGSGRYFYRLDPQDSLNFGIILLSLLLTLASWRSPLAGVQFCGWHTYGTPVARIGNARVHAIGLCLAICTRTVDALAQGRATGCRSGVYLGFSQAREAERHRPTLPGSLDIDSLCLVHSPHHLISASLLTSDPRLEAFGLWQPLNPPPTTNDHRLILVLL